MVKKEECEDCRIIVDEDCNEENNFQPCKNSAAISVANMLCQDTAKDKHKCDILFDKVVRVKSTEGIEHYLNMVEKLLPKEEVKALNEVRKLWKSK